MSEFSKNNADCFCAEVISADPWIVKPLITEMDGTPHPEIEVEARDGVTPEVGDTVLILTMRNNLDCEPISRYYEASASNGVIVGVMKAEDYKLTGNYTYVGDMTVEGNLTVTGTLTVGLVNINLHTHSGVTPGGGFTGPMV